MIGLNDNLLQNIIYCVSKPLIFPEIGTQFIHLIKQKSLIIQNVHAHIVSIAKLFISIFDTHNIIYR